MNHLPPHQEQTLIPQPEICRRLGKTHSGLTKLRKKDPTFPKPIKFSDTRQAASYYVAAEIDAWLQQKIDQRDGKAA